MRKLALILFALSLAIPGLAQDKARTDVPPVIVSGFEAYKPSDAEAAIKAWTKNSPLDGTKAALDAAASLHAAQDAYGQFQWFDIVSNRELSPRVRIVYLTLNYDRGPLFARFVAYHNDRGWILTALDFSLDDTRIVPITAE